MYLNALYCCLLTRGDLEPPRPSRVTHRHITPTHSTAGCFSSPLKPQVTAQGTHWILVEVLSRPHNLIPACPRGSQGCVVSGIPAWSQSRPKTAWESLCGSTRAWGTRWPWDWGLVRDCGATWALGAGAASACWRCQGVGRSGVSAGGASALRHPGFLASPSSPWPVSSFAWPAMAAIPWCSEGK